MDISPDVVILTRAELKAREGAAFQRGVERGKFEAAVLAGNMSAANITKANDAFEGKDQGSAIIYRERAEAQTEVATAIKTPRAIIPGTLLGIEAFDYK